MSTIFSQNPSLSIYGSYDRLEVLITTSFYLIFTFIIANYRHKTFGKQLLWGIIIASGLSSLYGIVQSFNLDIVSWSIDPGKRVFGSINNPVHYCAIMGMAIPSIIGCLFYLIEKTPNQQLSKKPISAMIAYYSIILIIVNIFPVQTRSINWIITYIVMFGAPYIVYGIAFFKNNTTQNKFNILFNTLLLVIYATFISYSRATWLGLTAALGFIFYLNTIIKQQLPKHSFIILTVTSLLLTMSTYLTIVFKLHTVSTTLSILSFAIIGISIIINSELLNKTRVELFFNIFIQSIIFILFLMEPSPWVPVSILVLIGIIYATRKKQFNYIPTQLILFITIFSTIQFTGVGVIQWLTSSLFIICLFATTIDPKHAFKQSKIMSWKLVIIIMFGFLFVSPNITVFLTDIQTVKSQKLLKQTTHKIDTYKSVAIEGTARTSMWKSSKQWILDHILIGSGLDTIKYMYPKYRRSDYGKLEGGHNYTPDRLHNEYLNTLATKGVIGFVLYYILFIGSCFLGALLTLHKHSESPIQYLILGAIGSSLVYLGQVLFNFGVVATLVFFFIYIGLFVSIKINHE